MQHTNASSDHEYDADDALDIFEDGEESLQAANAKDWRVLIVDDDREVHKATLFALNDLQVDGRGLRFLHAYTAAEARTKLLEESDIAVALLDVVMESENAGLDLVRAIRDEFGLLEMRIILRTGQPGYAPEMHVIRDYDINDYKTKSELTRIRLLTTLTTAIRSYDQIRTISASRRGLAMIVNSAADLFSQRALRNFAEGVLTQIAALLGLPPEGLLCARDSFSSGPGATRPLTVVGAAGSYRELIDRPLEEINDPAIVDSVRRCLAEQQNIYGERATALYFKGDPANGGHAASVYIATEEPLSETDRQLLEVFCVNISVGLENVNLFSELQQFAYFDPLTHLPNRSGFIEAIDTYRRDGICNAENTRGNCTVALIDIAHFSAINDALGHKKGDLLLLAVGRRLHSGLPAGTTVARVGGDVFGLLAPDEVLDPAALLALFDEPIAVDDYLLPIRASIGLTRLIDDQSSGLDLLKTTNIALNRAKHEGHSRWCYHTPEMTEGTRNRLELLQELRLALTNRRGLSLHYQPQIDLATGAVIGAEALIRWRTDEGRNIPPDQFISLAEYSGLIRDLGAWVFCTAFEQLKVWDAAGLPPLRMAVNVSPAQFLDPNFANRLEKIVAEVGVAPQRIELEITEGVVMQDAESVISTLQALRKLGFEVAVDDFGTGFSSLSYLQRLPVNRLKIDRSFVGDMNDGGGSGNSIAHTIIRLGQSLGLSVVAEGVETEAQGEMLRNMGCDLAQGYFYSRPVDGESFVAWMGETRGHRHPPFA